MPTQTCRWGVGQGDYPQVHCSISYTNYHHECYYTTTKYCYQLRHSMRKLDDALVCGERHDKEDR